MSADKPDVAALTEDQAMAIFRAENQKDPYGSIYRSIRTAYAAGREYANKNEQHASWYRFIRAGYCKEEHITEEKFDANVAEAIKRGAIP